IIEFDVRTDEMLVNMGPQHPSTHGVYDVDTRRPEPALTIEIYRVSMGLMEKRTFTWDEINGRQLIAPLPPGPPPAKRP
ncbi:MAG: hypothetical protein HYR88_12350, partial [Verrucomicrobia bacterium]|nr:hypothetical protein [Verrucomicrobiota bacterium]